MLLITINNTGINFIKEAITFTSPKHDWLIYLFFLHVHYVIHRLHVGKIFTNSYIVNRQMHIALLENTEISITSHHTIQLNSIAMLNSLTRHHLLTPMSFQTCMTKHILNIVNRFCLAGGLEIVTLSHSSFIYASVEKHVMEQREDGQGEVCESKSEQSKCEFSRAPCERLCCPWSNLGQWSSNK